MTSSIKNGRYAFLIRLDFQSHERSSVITNFKRPIKHLIKLILYENDVKLLKFKRSHV